MVLLVAEGRKEDIAARDWEEGEILQPGAGKKGRYCSQGWRGRGGIAARGGEKGDIAARVGEEGEVLQPGVGMMPGANFRKCTPENGLFPFFWQHRKLYSLVNMSEKQMAGYY